MDVGAFASLWGGSQSNLVSLLLAHPKEGEGVDNTSKHRFCIFGLVPLRLLDCAFQEAPKTITYLGVGFGQVYTQPGAKRHPLGLLHWQCLRAAGVTCT